MKYAPDRSQREVNLIPTAPKEAKEIVPQTFEQIREAIFRFSGKESVVLNLEGLSVGFAQRMLDFVSGAVYVLQGTIKKVENSKYLLIPQGVKVRKVKEKR